MEEVKKKYLMVDFITEARVYHFRSEVLAEKQRINDSLSLIMGDDASDADILVQTAPAHSAPLGASTPMQIKQSNEPVPGAKVSSLAALFGSIKDDDVVVQDEENILYVGLLDKSGPNKILYPWLPRLLSITN